MGICLKVHSSFHLSNGSLELRSRGHKQSCAAPVPLPCQGICASIWSRLPFLCWFLFSTCISFFKYQQVYSCLKNDVFQACSSNFAELLKMNTWLWWHIPYNYGASGLLSIPSAEWSKIIKPHAIHFIMFIHPRSYMIYMHNLWCFLSQFIFSLIYSA